MFKKTNKKNFKDKPYLWKKCNKLWRDVFSGHILANGNYFPVKALAQKSSEKRGAASNTLNRKKDAHVSLDHNNLQKHSQQV